MGVTYKHILVVLCTLIDVSVDGQDCIFKECFCSGSSIECEAKGLMKIPVIIPSSNHYSTLNLDENAITDIPEGNLPPNLTEIYLDQNPITTIAEAAFDYSISTLETITFAMATMTRISDAFCHLKTLKILRILNTKIQEWNDEAMMNIGQTVDTLDLDNVGLMSWPTWLKYFPRLTELTIATSSISTIPDDAFDNVTNSLTKLTLESNNLTILPKSLSNCTILQELYIDNNRIVDLTWLPRAGKMMTLSLSSNIISDANHLSNSIYRFQESLQYLNLDTNRLVAIPNISFLTLVKDLDFSNNKLSDPYSGSLASTVRSIDFSNNFLPLIPRVLTSLNQVLQIVLPSNSITRIQASDILPSTTIVNLGNNLITELSDNCFPINSSMITLQLNNNPISTISIMAFNNLGLLQSLNLENTRLTRLPLALSSLTSIYDLDMLGNSQLVCTCEEKSLQQFILKLSYFSVSGNCGLVDIYQFYVTFSSLCPT